MSEMKVEFSHETFYGVRGGPREKSEVVEVNDLNHTTSPIFIEFKT